MPVIVVRRFNPYFKRVYDCLTAKGKHAKVAITVIMRKLIVLVNALLREKAASGRQKPLDHCGYSKWSAFCSDGSFSAVCVSA
ncbi:MAG: hypothetical protein ABF535_03525 [Acetobacter sp.]